MSKCCNLREFSSPMMKYSFCAWTCLKRTGGPCAQEVDENFSIDGHHELYVELKGDLPWEAGRPRVCTYCR